MQEQLPVVTYERDSSSGGSEPKSRKTSNGRRVGISGSRPILPPEGVSDAIQNLDVMICNYIWFYDVMTYDFRLDIQEELFQKFNLMGLEIFSRWGGEAK